MLKIKNTVNMEVELIVNRGWSFEPYPNKDMIYGKTIEKNIFIYVMRNRELWFEINCGDECNEELMDIIFDLIKAGLVEKR